MALDENFFKDESNNKGNYGIRELVQSGDGEQILWEGKPNGKSYVWGRVVQMMPIALIWLAFDGFAIGMIFSHIFELPTFAYFIFGGFFLIHLTPVWMWIASIVTAFKRLKNTEYAFTDKRIIIKTGFFAKFDTVFYSDIAAIDLHVGFIDRMFKVGDIILKTNSGSTYMVEDIDNPYFIQERLQKISNDIKTDMQFPNDLRPEENHGYNTKYKG